MMYSSVAFLALISGAEAFNAAPVMRVPALSRSHAIRMEEAPAAPAKVEETVEEAEPAPPPPPAVVYSESMPFLVKRKALDGYVGDVGFDPLGFSEILPMDWLREAELKHARVCMLAFVGFVFTDFYHLPGFDYTTLEAHDACVASGAMSQLLLWIGLLEVVGAIGVDQTLRGSGRAAGDFGFDPVGFGSDPEKLKELQMKELANGRLAMFAFAGVVTQAVLTGNSFPYLFGDATTFGATGTFPLNIIPM